MRCRQTVKLIGEVNQSVGKPTKILAGTKAKRLKSDSLQVNEKLAVSQQRKPHHFDGQCIVNQLTGLEKDPGTLQRNTRPKAYYFNDTLPRDSELDAMNATDN